VLIIQQIADSVLAYVRRRARSDLAQLLVPERILVRTMPHAKVQAMTVWADPVHAIVVNRGLMLFVYRVARAIAPHMIVRGPQDPSPPPEGDTVGIITQLVDWLSSPVNAPIAEDWPAGPREIRTAENIATASERFVLSHESRDRALLESVERMLWKAPSAVLEAIVANLMSKEEYLRPGHRPARPTANGSDGTSSHTSSVATFRPASVRRSAYTP
jgi:hypothetical protein